MHWTLVTRASDLHVNEPEEKMMNEDIQFGCNDGACQTCDVYGPVNDIGLCEDCNAKVDRDLIRKRDWDYSVSAFGCPVDKREELRNQVISQYGEELELLAEEQSSKKAANTRSKKRKRKKKR